MKPIKDYLPKPIDRMLIQGRVPTEIVERTKEIMIEKNLSWAKVLTACLKAFVAQHQKKTTLFEIMGDTSPEEKVKYKSKAAQDAQRANYGDSRYWQYLDDSAKNKSEYYKERGNEKSSKEMLTRSLADALQGNDGD